jgi:HAD superfamily hydrolase (TIGR01509 family)
MSIAALLFDMDGVVINSHADVTNFWLEMAAKYGVHLTDDDFAHHIYGCPMRHTLDVCFPMLDAAQQAAAHAYHIDYEINLTYTPIPGILPLLESLRQRGVPTALVTGGEAHKVQTVLDQLDLHAAFRTTVNAGEIPRGKPHPDGYLLAAERLGIAPGRCLVFEDAVNGVQSALAAGAHCVGVDSWGNGPALLPLGIYALIPDFSAVRLVGAALHLDGSHILTLDLPKS